MFATILETSNFAGHGPARVGSYGSLGPFGTYDTAGNVREWCLNASGDKRYILGGAWNEPKYMFYLPDAALPFDRSSGNGFRCAKYERPPAGELSQPTDSLLATSRRDAVPVSDAIFEVYRAIHRYDHGELDAKVEATDDASPYWRQEKISFRAAYGNERVAAYLFLPKNADRPFQTVVTFPGTYAFDIPSSARLETQWFDFIMRSGRAVMHPIYKGTYERTIGGNFTTFTAQPGVWRELALQWYKDLGRSLDYLETRPELDREKLAYQGISIGAAQGPRFMALEPRLKAGVLLWGGFGWAPSEVNSLHFASRCTAPTLMVNGRADMIFPLETSQVPMFRLLGAADTDKRHVVLEGGHVAFNQEVVRLVLGWLDKYLGPVKTR
jgi:dienelactone hydrolase